MLTIFSSVLALIWLRNYKNTAVTSQMYGPDAIIVPIGKFINSY
jgi:hypothetical protein